MVKQITTALIALMFTAVMVWLTFSPFLAPQLWFRAYYETEIRPPQTKI
jgi:hypothetical protein